MQHADREVVSPKRIPILWMGTAIWLRIQIQPHLRNRNKGKRELGRSKRCSVFRTEHVDLANGRAVWSHRTLRFVVLLGIIEHVVAPLVERSGLLTWVFRTFVFIGAALVAKKFLSP